MHCSLKLQTLRRTDSVSFAEVLGSFHNPWQMKLIQPNTYLWELLLHHIGQMVVILR